jgi:DNA-binding beta-propeller fold protein YncE
LILIAVLSLGASSPVLGGTAPSFLLKWGTSGSGGGQFDAPGGIAVDAGGLVYVADRNNDRIQKFAADGTLVLQWGSTGSGNGQFSSPRDVAVDGDGFVYVADYFNTRIQKFKANGTFVMAWGSPGTGDGQFSAPRGVAADGNGFIYVADDGFSAKRIQKFTAAGAFVAKWGVPGSGDGQFLSPRGVAADPAGNVYVSDTLNDRIQKFSNTGSFLGKWGQTGSLEGQFAFPIGVAWGNGCLYVVDSNNHRIQGFDAGGVHQFTFGSQCSLPGGAGCTDPDGGGPQEPGDGQFYFPGGIVVDGTGRVLVTDTQNDRVEAFGTGAQVGIGSGGSAFRTRLTAFPNPTADAATLGFRLAGPADGGREDYGVRAEIFDVSGRLVHVLFEGRLPSGDHELRWDGSTRDGGPASPGVFYTRVRVTGEPVRTAKILLLP